MGTKSENLKESYLEFLKKITGESKKINRTKRDNFYNIITYRERAVKLICALEYNSSKYVIKHKKDSALKILSWKRKFIELKPLAVIKG